MNFATLDDLELHNSLKLVEQSLSLCKKFDVPFYSFHPGYLAQDGEEKKNGHFEFQPTNFLNYKEAADNF